MIQWQLIRCACCVVCCVDSDSSYLQKKKQSCSWVFLLLFQWPLSPFGFVSFCLLKAFQRDWKIKPGMDIHPSKKLWAQQMPLGVISLSNVLLKAMPLFFILRCSRYWWLYYMSTQKRDIKFPFGHFTSFHNADIKKAVRQHFYAILQSYKSAVIIGWLYC